VKYLGKMVNLEGKALLRLSPDGYTGLVSKVTGKPFIAFQIEKEVAEVLGGIRVIGIQFDSVDELKQFLSTIEKKMWQWEHDEA